MRLLELVVPPYKAAYTILQQYIVNPFLKDLSTDNETAIKEVISDLTCAVQYVGGALNAAINSSQKLRIEVNQKLVDTASAISAKEKEISSMQGEIQHEASEIKVVKVKLVTDEQSANEKEQGVINAENNVHSLQEKVEDVRDCLFKNQRRKSVVFSTRSDCGNIVNSVKIENADRVLNNAEEKLQNSQIKIDDERQQLSTLQGQQNNSEKELSVSRHELRELQLTYIVLQELNNSTAIISQDLKMVTSHITKTWSGSELLYTTINNLMNFDRLINPLNEVYKVFERKHLLQNIRFSMVSDLTLTQVKHSFKTTAKLIPQMPLNLFISSVNCTVQD
ncbi:unnamed protein product [Rotaria magnacalcarata]|uniref:Uncharacterized protein n=1 Tax=Rotaria magnacalcarata TaxID=392030 RepID=A0A817ABI0_9BILA|nr:unnamed protein product [Rotaria magnacalcarata]CAF1516137.1 unnamed protein product [Rotaria magnacalcarata]CAF2253391.1 unnamed protein product [Rotaria magnacalcarata]CAF3769435.1 unnamed protein product [Rotaria magnacalcarata]CAF3798029.1 unnamed protein product [Rotaria magnacalcarata]